MRKWKLVAGIAIAVWTGGGGFGAASGQQAGNPPRSDALAAEQARLRNGEIHLHYNDWQGARDVFQAALADPAFPILTPAEQFGVRSGLGMSDFQLEDFANALPLLKQVTETEWTDYDLWSARLDAAWRLKDYGDCVTSLSAIAQRWPDSLSQTRDYVFTRVEKFARDLPDNHQRDLAYLNALFAARWRPTDVFNGPDPLWLQLTTFRVAKGDIAGAVLVSNE
jgi:tetratricopeptide (TPR) repeat protein